MKCPVCKNFCYESRHCTGCVPSLLDRRKVTNAFGIDDAAALFNRCGWRSDGVEHSGSGEATCRFYHEQESLPPFFLKLHRKDNWKQLSAVVPVCDFDSNQAHLLPELNELVNRLNGRYMSAKCCVGDGVVYFLVSLPLLEGISELDLVYAFEREFTRIVSVVASSGLLEAAGLFTPADDSAPDGAGRPKLHPVH